MTPLLSWSRQPTTVAGLSALVATSLGLATHQLNWPQAVPLLMGAVVSIILPDNSQAKQNAEMLSRDIIDATNRK